MSLHPIIYIRGYAMTESERNETAADPFCGFNVGSTVYRATPDRSARADKFVFESPVLRLVTEYGYRHVYQNGSDILDPDWTPPPSPDGEKNEGIPPQSIVVYRYYDDGSGLLGDGKAKSIESYASGLSDLILKVRALVAAWRGPGGRLIAPERFRCYLVAHSMGGLVARAFLQNKKLGNADARRSVDKLFTFATPHNGIEIGGGINVPSWLSAAEADTFNRERMAGYLDMGAIAKANGGRVDFIPEDVLPADRVFCLVGTNRGDYEVAQGIVRAFVGHGSDGLVRVANASLWGIDRKTLLPTVPVATAYAYRSHSGRFGIVNSEEAYQNLVRFLFGDLRIDIWADIDTVRLPAALEDKADKVDALYQFELLAAARGKRWFLSRRVAEEDSPACRTQRQLAQPKSAQDNGVYLSTVFLSNRARVNAARPSLAYAMTFAARVPDYQVEKRFWADQHYEGGNLFRDTAIIEMTPPLAAGDDWEVRFNWMSKSDGVATKKLKYTDLGGSALQIDIPFDNPKKPGISGRIRLVVRRWNADPDAG
jgi:hypothetical protein